MTHEYGQASHIRPRGGYGLQFCRETLQVSNVSVVATLQDYFARIWLMACGPAGTIVSPTRPFCREFATYADAPVIASDTEQTYYPGIEDPVRQVSMRTLRFGQWEGNVYQFDPDGAVTKLQTLTLGSPCPEQRPRRYSSPRAICFRSRAASLASLAGAPRGRPKSRAGRHSGLGLRPMIGPHIFIATPGIAAVWPLSKNAHPMQGGKTGGRSDAHLR